MAIQCLLNLLNNQDEENISDISDMLVTTRDSSRDGLSPLLLLLASPEQSVTAAATSMTVLRHLQPVTRLQQMMTAATKCD